MFCSFSKSLIYRLFPTMETRAAKPPGRELRKERRPSESLPVMKSVERGLPPAQPGKKTMALGDNGISTGRETTEDSALNPF